jgi:hypothetical protein
MADVIRLVGPADGIALQRQRRNRRHAAFRHACLVHADVLAIDAGGQIEEFGRVRRAGWRHDRTGERIDMSFFVTNRAERHALAQLQAEKATATMHRLAGHLVGRDQGLIGEIASLGDLGKSLHLLSLVIESLNGGLRRGLDLFEFRYRRLKNQLAIREKWKHGHGFNVCSY